MGIMETVFIYNTLKNELCESFQQVVENQIPAAKRELFQSFEELIQKLSRSSHEKIVMVYVAADSEELSNLIAIREKLFNINLILILQDFQPVFFCGNMKCQVLASFCNQCFT